LHCLPEKKLFRNLFLLTQRKEKHPIRSLQLGCKKKSSASQRSIDLRLVDQETRRLLALTHEFSQPNHIMRVFMGLTFMNHQQSRLKSGKYEPWVIAICKSLPVFGFRRSNLHGNLSKVDFPLGKYAKSWTQQTQVIVV
jgi:hypothetical protein